MTLREWLAADPAPRDPAPHDPATHCTPHPATGFGPFAWPEDRDAVPVTDITDDSRLVRPGAAFIARRGAHASGHDYLHDAVQRGAAVVLVERPSVDPHGAHTPTPTSLGLPDSVTVAHGPPGSLDAATLGRLAARFFGDPASRLRLVGVTGTNGKTTTAFVIQHLLQTARLRCGMIGTVWIDDGRSRRQAALTTPGVVEMNRLLAQMADHGCDAVVMEVSSHALDQGRVAGLRFEVGVFTNLTGDHLDYHGTMDRYAAAKALLFESLDARAWAMVNLDDPYASRMTERCEAHVTGCSLMDASLKEAGATARILELSADSSRAVFDGPWGSLDVRLPLVGRHNVMNALEALTAANAVVALGRHWREGLATCPPVPGRLEPVRFDPARAIGSSSGRSSSPPVTPTVLVDYAHTHDALENVLLALRAVTAGESRLICVFGCGGDRDRAKRPKMAEVACRFADAVVISSDNPRTEDPKAIIDQIRSGVPADGASRVRVEPDRREAIRSAVLGARPLDVVLIAGKGHEDYQIVGREKRHFDDREEASSALSAWWDQHEGVRR